MHINLLNKTQASIKTGVSERTIYRWTKEDKKKKSKINTYGFKKSKIPLVSVPEILSIKKYKHA